MIMYLGRYKYMCIYMNNIAMFICINIYTYMNIYILQSYECRYMCGYKHMHICM